MPKLVSISSLSEHPIPESSEGEGSVGSFRVTIQLTDAEYEAISRPNGALSVAMELDHINTRDKDFTKINVKTAEPQSFEPNDEIKFNVSMDDVSVRPNSGKYLINFDVGVGVRNDDEIEKDVEKFRLKVVDISGTNVTGTTTSELKSGIKDDDGAEQSVDVSFGGDELSGDPIDFGPQSAFRSATTGDGANVGDMLDGTLSLGDEQPNRFEGLPLGRDDDVFEASMPILDVDLLLG